MNDLEIRDFWEMVFIQFPTLKSWLSANSPDVPKTLGVWSNALRGVSAAECLSVLQRWSNGELEPPTGYQRETFHLHVRAVVMADRAKRAGAYQREEAFRKANIGEPRPEILVRCGEVFDKIAALKRQWDSGFITKEQLDCEVAAIVDAAHAEIDMKSRRVG